MPGFRMRFVPLLLALLFAVPAARAQQSVARQWDEEALDAIRIDRPRPPVHARNLFHMSAAMYDAWAAYDATARGYYFTEKIVPTGDVETARAEAISYAAYRLLAYRYTYSIAPGRTLTNLADRMAALGYDTNLTSAVGNDAFAVGNRIASNLIAYGVTDGANETSKPNSYRANNGYAPVNAPLIVALPAIAMADPNRWQPLSLANSFDQGGNPVPESNQTAVAPHWGYVKPFALMRQQTNQVYEDRGTAPQFAGATHEQYVDEMVEVLEDSSYLDPADTNLIDISPGVFGNNSLGANDGHGYGLNPVTGQPYTSEVVRIGDFGRVIAEFWADGPDSETPPGHWNVLANYASDRITNFQIGGTGPVLTNRLEWDVKLYLGLNGALHDAAIAAWNHKGVTDSVRPISGLRYMGSLGQSSDSNQPSFHTNGLPLIPDLIELITSETTTNGGKHANFATNVGEVAVRAWLGPVTATNIPNPTSWYGVGWTRARMWVPYQLATFVTPPFPGFISGHSTYSRSAAEYLSRFTGSIYFPSGLYEFVALSNDYLSFELGPSTDVRLQAATYYDAADQAGQSRLWGGIHIEADDFNGRRAGAKIGRAAYELAVQYYAGVPAPHPLFKVEVEPATNNCVISWPAISGRQYTVYSSTNLGASFDAGTVYNATGPNVVITGALLNAAEFFRISVTNGP
jgi:hypothetical protein